jgi:ABC-2 type transport system permease protein
MFKEISSFFSTLSAYIVIGVFLLTNGLFLWLIPGGDNILDGAYADMSAFFNIAPNLFLFLIPAVCMKMFAEERRVGTLDLLFTRPLSSLKIVLSKYIAALLLVLIAIIPSLIYFFTIYNLAVPIGNVDIGSVIGSYIGLFFLSSIFVSVSLFASSLSDNQVVSFIIGVILCFLLYSGFDYISSLHLFDYFENEIRYLGISSHYLPMSRGVIDTRDFIWFVLVVSVFIYFTKRRIEIF